MRLALRGFSTWEVGWGWKEERKERGKMIETEKGIGS